jgi:hypothetical protein
MAQLKGSGYKPPLQTLGPQFSGSQRKTSGKDGLEAVQGNRGMGHKQLQAGWVLEDLDPPENSHLPEDTYGTDLPTPILPPSLPANSVLR